MWKETWSSWNTSTSDQPIYLYTDTNEQTNNLSCHLRWYVEESSFPSTLTGSLSNSLVLEVIPSRKSFCLVVIIITHGWRVVRVKTHKKYIMYRLSVVTPNHTHRQFVYSRSWSSGNKLLVETVDDRLTENRSYIGKTRSQCKRVIHITLRSYLINYTVRILSRTKVRRKMDTERVPRPPKGRGK